MKENERIILERRMREQPLDKIERDLAAGIYGEAKRKVVEHYVVQERRRLASTAEGRREVREERATAAAEIQATSARRALWISVAAFIVSAGHVAVDYLLS